MRKLLFAFLLIISFNVYALERIALVIGNAKYLDDDLNNPVNDAKDIAASLEELGFEVKLIEDANKTTMKQAIEKFGSQLNEDTISLFYYAGHAKQLHTVNYLLPIHSIKAIKKNFTNLSEYEKLERFNDEAINLTPLIKLIEDGNSKLNIIILDACRDNSISGAQEGLSKMLLVSKNTLIAYSTSPGKKADDYIYLQDGGKSRNSPYTRQLLKFIKTPNQLIESMLKDVGSALDTETNGEQLPWVEHNLTSNFCFNDVDGGCAKILIPILDIPFLDGLYNIEVMDLDNGDHYIGQMKNGMFNGKGVMKFTNGATYEGNFLDNQKSGFGALTQPNGNSYEGNFLSDKKHGKGTLRFISGAIIETEWDMGIRIFTPEYFSGERDNQDKKHGNGVLVTSNGEKYEGFWNHGTLEGEVEVTFSNGDLYKGEWENGNPNGKGTKFDTQGQIYEGTFINGKLTGHGFKTWFNGDVYLGGFLDDKQHGYGIFTSAYDGEKEGEWENGFLNGKGHRVKVNGDRYDGDFLKDQYHGIGTYTWNDGGSYEGQWKHNQFNGRGKYTWPSGSSYEGEYLNGSRHGKGFHTYSNGSTYEGEYLNGNKNGKGIFTMVNGTRYEVVIENDEVNSFKAIEINKE